MTRQTPLPPAVGLIVLLVSYFLGPLVCEAVYCEGTADDLCNGLLGTCTDSGLCVVGPDGVECTGTPNTNLCGSLSITNILTFANEVTTTETSNVPVSNPVEYDCEFINRWSAADHPNDYPSDSAHWSRMVIASHSTGYQMWAPDTQGTAGVQDVAERGNIAELTNELNAAGSNVMSTSVGTVQFNSNTQRQTISSISMDAGHTYMTTITMVAPSPDWFTGFYDFDASENGFWYQRFVIDTFPFDAGTDSGTTYDSSNSVTNPQEPIFQLTFDTVPQSEVFVSPNGPTVLPVATWDCSIVAIAPTIPPNPPTAAPTIASQSPTFLETTPPPTQASQSPSVSPMDFSLNPTFVEPTVAPVVPSLTPSFVASSSAPSGMPSVAPSQLPTTLTPPVPTTRPPSDEGSSSTPVTPPPSELTATSAMPSASPSDSSAGQKLELHLRTLTLCLVVSLQVIQFT